MRLLTLTIITAATFACEASAQTATQLPASGVPYSDRQPLLRRRPFAPGGQFTPPPTALPGWEPPYLYQYPPPMRWTISSPYSMIHYDWLPRTRPPEALPAPVPPGQRPPMPPAVPPSVPPKPPTTPAKPPVPPSTTPTRPTFLPTDGQE